MNFEFLNFYSQGELQNPKEYSVFEIPIEERHRDGGASGIGRSICSRFGSEGATVVIADIDDLEGHKTQERLSDSGCASIFVQADVSCEKDVTRLVHISENFMSGIDVVVNNAGPFEFGDIVKSSPEGLG